jgi:large subunit ribosomal protein L9
MEVILREDIDKLGTRGQVVKVAAGYARNFLLPKRLAVAATESNKKIVEQERQAYLRKEAKLQSEAQDLANLMTGVSVTITQKAGENDQLFGSVTSKDVADALVAKGYTIDRRKVQLDEPIKQLGEFKVPVRLHKEVTVELTVVVAKEEAKVVVAKDETKKEEAKEEPKKEEAKEE